ncbi:MAG: M81 family metallopeptidase [Pirellulales bacterium]
MRCGILAFLHESNTFVSAKTTWADFASDVLACGEAVRERFTSSPHEIGGFFAGLEQERITAVPVMAARALPNGVIEAGTFERLLGMMIDELERALPLDAVLVAPHGATVSEQALDADGYWLSQIRRRLGPQVPIIGTIDPHANLSQQMVDACDALIAYRTNPHIDQRERGEEAARLLGRTLRGEIRPTMAAAFPPLAIRIDCQATDEPPCRDWFQLAEEIRRAPGVLSASIVLGFPYADVPEMGTSTMVVTDNDGKLAQQYADQLALAIWNDRSQLLGPSLDVEHAIDRALAAEPPVCLLDMGDNVGGGSPADSTWLAAALHRRRVARSLVVLHDPTAATAAKAAGVGSRLMLEVGGKSGPLSGSPLAAEFVVRGLYDGTFSEAQPTHGGFTTFDQGLTAVLTTDSDLTAIVTSRRMVPFSLGQLTSCGIDPAAYRVLVAKGVNAPIAAYIKVCRTFIRVDTPGVTAADMTQLSYQHRRRPMFPFEPEGNWLASNPTACAR